MKKLTHRNLVKACIEYLEAKGYVTQKNNTGMTITKNPYGKKRVIRYGKKGSADILSCSPKGRFCAWEIKIGDDVQSQEQIDYEISVIKNGGVYHIIRDIDTFMEIVEKWRY